MSEPDARSEPPRHYRSAAVARMLRMPVGTLRVWERRYGISGAATSAAGHRLYSAADVQRLALLRQLLALGHAIGSLAPLDMAALQAVARTHAQALSPPAGPPALPPQDELSDPEIPERRFDDASLADMAGLSTTLACECPQHLADILSRLGRFEAYSADCRQRSPADAHLHAYLQRVTARARAQFEAALARVALHEGLWPAPGAEPPC
jgi:DNA-binding transcriptional MerR regulator